jgi:hypothetical protein
MGTRAPERGSAFVGAEPGDRGGGRIGGSGVYRPYRTVGGPHVPSRRCGVETRAGADAGIAGHRFPVISLFSVCSRQRHSSNQICAVRRRRAHHHAYRGGQISVLLHRACERSFPGARRTVGAGRRRHRFGHLAPAGGEPVAGEIATGGGKRRGAGGGVQYSYRGGSICARRNHGRSPRARARFSRGRLGYRMDGAPSLSGRPAAVPRLGVSIGASGGICALRSAGRGGRAGVRRLCKTAALAAAEIPALAENGRCGSSQLSAG